MTGNRQKARGVVLIVVLWVVSVLAAVCLALGGTVRSRQVHLRRNRGDLAAQQGLAGAVALAKKVLLGDAVAADTLADGWSGQDAEGFTLTLGGMTTQLFTPTGRWGLEDESSRLNANTASAEMLARLPGVTASAAEALVAARESIRQAGSRTGAGSGSLGLTGPYAMPCQLANALVSAFVEAGLYSPGEAAEPYGTYGGEGYSWASQLQLPSSVAEALKYLTVYSRQRNVDGEGRRRVNINGASRTDLAAAVGGQFTDEQIDAILLSRAARPFESVGELLIREMEVTDAEGTKKTVRIEREQLKPVVDRLTATDAEVIPGLVNVNTAPAEVLRCLPGLTEADVSAIIAHRAGAVAASLASIGWLLDVLSEKAFAEVCPFVTVRSQQFRMRVEGRPGWAEEVSSAGGPASGQAAAVREASAYALAVLERDGRRCNVLLWLQWTALPRVSVSVTGRVSPGWHGRL